MWPLFNIDDRWSCGQKINLDKSETKIFYQYILQIKDLYSRKDTNLVFSRFISRGDGIHSFWNALRICRKINQLHQSSFYTSSIYYTTQNNPWICQYRFNGKVFLIFSVSPLRHIKLKKSTVEFHTSKNILKMIKQRNQSHQVLFYISNTL
jgi:hypothetical protein